MKVRHQVGDLVDGELVLKARHLGAPHLDDVDHSLIVGWDAARHVLLLEEAVETWPAQVTRAVSIMAFGTASVVDAPAACLLWVQAQLCVAFLRLCLAAGESRQNNRGEDEQDAPHRQLRDQPNLPREIGRTRERGPMV